MKSPGVRHARRPVNFQFQAQRRNLADKVRRRTTLAVDGISERRQRATALALDARGRAGGEPEVRARTLAHPARPPQLRARCGPADSRSDRARRAPARRAHRVRGVAGLGPGAVAAGSADARALARARGGGAAPPISTPEQGAREKPDQDSQGAAGDAEGPATGARRPARQSGRRGAPARDRRRSGAGVRPSRARRAGSSTPGGHRGGAGTRRGGDYFEAARRSIPSRRWSTKRSEGLSVSPIWRNISR
jgi:hypothetical protein